ncbi:alpha-1B-glycoprotein-like [Cetorhinus maximus]
MADGSSFMGFPRAVKQAEYVSLVVKRKWELFRENGRREESHGFNREQKIEDGLGNNQAEHCYKMPVCRFKSILQMVSVSILLMNDFKQLPTSPPAQTSAIFISFYKCGASYSCLAPNRSYPLPQPILSLDPPSSVILPGEEVSLVCHFPLTGCSVEFYRNHKDILDYVNEVSYTAKVKLEADIKWKGNNAYICKYRKYFENNGTWACSPHSDPVQLIVTDKLPNPTASIEPVSGVVTVGDRVQINCTTSYPSPISHLYKKHGKKPVESRNVSGSERSVILTMKDLEPEDSGEYSCSFDKTVKGNVVTSWSSMLPLHSPGPTFLSIHPLVWSAEGRPFELPAQDPF